MSSIIGTPSSFTVAVTTSPVAQTHTSSAIPAGVNRAMIVALAVVQGSANGIVTAVPTADGVPMLLISVTPPTASVFNNRLYVYITPISDSKTGTVSIVVTRDSVNMQYVSKVVFIQAANAASLTASVNSAFSSVQIAPVAVTTSPLIPSTDIALSFFTHCNAADLTATMIGNGTQVGAGSFSSFAQSAFMDIAIYMASSIGLTTPSFQWSMSALTSTIRCQQVSLSINHRDAQFVKLRIKLRGT